MQRAGRTGSDRKKRIELVDGEGFEPPKAKPADLQSAPVDRLGTHPEHTWSHLSDSNRRPSAYKAGALPTELKWQGNI